MDIIVNDDAWEKLWAYTDVCNTEIAAFGYVSPNEVGDLVVSEVFLVPQEVSSVEVDFVTEGLPYAVDKAAQEDRINELRFIWHSHVNMGTGYSGTDEEMIRKVRDAGPIPWLATAIFNKKGETNGRLDVFKPGLHAELDGLRHIKGIELDILSESSLRTQLDCVGEIESFVKKQKSDPTRGSHKPGATTTKGGTSPAAAELNAGKCDPNLTPVSDVYEIQEMTEEQLDKELDFAQEMYRRADAEGWDKHEDSEGWMYWFDASNKYMGQSLSLEVFNPDNREKDE